MKISYVHKFLKILKLLNNSYVIVYNRIGNGNINIYLVKFSNIYGNFYFSYIKKLNHLVKICWF